VSEAVVQGRAPSAEVSGFPVACVITATDAAEALTEAEPGVSAVDVATRKATEAGARPVVAVVPRGVAVAPPARVLAHAQPPAGENALLRLGLTQLANVPVRGALVWPAAFAGAAASSARAVLDAARRGVAQVIVPAYLTRPGMPAFFAREMWLDVMTASAGGARGVIASYGRRALDVAVNDEGVVRTVPRRAAGPNEEERNALP
jgi:hypothetical protein